MLVNYSTCTDYVASSCYDSDAVALDNAPRNALHNALTVRPPRTVPAKINTGRQK